MMPPSHRFAIPRPLSAGVILAAMLGAGCLSKPALKHETFAFQAPPPAVAKGATPGRVLACAVTVSPLFSGASFVYRTGPEAYETDPYAEFLVAPAQAVAIATRARLQASGRFRDVVETGSRARADQLAEFHVSELYGDFSRPNESAAVVSMRLALFEEGESKVRQPVVVKHYSRRVPLRDRTAAAVMSGWEAALEEILAEAASDLAPAQK